ncbi:hypothetical protein AK830_g12009 [Neonectria ditissima]|uniref:Uncharacterized protein n=1 Tax=Neonectria ditissima TaxID=78410 RepID=A0A0P7AKV7_9HYPO|nr:hypothetical protein AK830_g12009 [Neonectria ditissima]
MKRFCVHPRCGICCLFFTHVGQDGPNSKPFNYKLFSYFQEGVTDPLYATCEESCHHNNESATGCHAVCLEHLAPVPAGEVIKKNYYSFEPSHSQDLARLRWLRDTLASRLTTPLLTAPELRQRVAQYLVQEYAASLSRTLGRTSCHAPKAVSIPFDQLHVDYEGKEYVAALINKPGQSDPGPMPKFLFVSHDHCGIRRIIAENSHFAPVIDHTPGVWWKTLRITGPKCTLELDSDVGSLFPLDLNIGQRCKLTWIAQGMKLRNLTYINGSENRPTRGMISWAIPRCPSWKIRSHAFCKRWDPSPFHMDLFPYNIPGITGISVSCNPSPVAFHVHTSNTDMSPYDPALDYSHWIYMPLDAGETISTIWMRKRKVSDNDLALALTTNKQRTVLLGDQATPNSSTGPWTLLDKSDGAPGRFFYDACHQGSRLLAFESAQPVEPSTYLRLPEPSSPHPRSAFGESFNWSSASVEEVTEVRLCRRQNVLQSEVVGLLFYYRNGTRASLGQVRLDSLEPHLTVDPSRSLYLAFRYGSNGCHYVADVEMSTAPPEDAAVTWFEVSWRGTLEWWLSYMRCHVWQNGRSSLDTTQTEQRALLL